MGKHSRAAKEAINYKPQLNHLKEFHACHIVHCLRQNHTVYIEKISWSGKQQT